MAAVTDCPGNGTKVVSKETLGKALTEESESMNAYGGVDLLLFLEGKHHISGESKLTRSGGGDHDLWERAFTRAPPAAWE